MAQESQGMARESVSNELRSRDRLETSSDIARLLGHRFGDGLVYFRDQGERKLFGLAVEWGLLSREGYLTPEGRSFLATHGAD